MTYKISTSYNYYETETERFLIKTYKINGIPFTFDELPGICQDDPQVIEEANENEIYTPVMFYQWSFYLIDEEVHPCLFTVDLENPELLDEIDSNTTDL